MGIKNTADVDLEYAFIFNGINGPKGKGFADFRTEEDRDKAISRCHMQKLEERDLNFRRITPEFFEMYGLTQQGFSPKAAPAAAGFNGSAGMFGLPRPAPAPRRMMPQVNTGFVDYGNTYGLNENFLQSLGIQSKLISRIFVNNLNTTT